MGIYVCVRHTCLVRTGDVELFVIGQRNALDPRCVAQQRAHRIVVDGALRMVELVKRLGKHFCSPPRGKPAIYEE